MDQLTISRPRLAEAQIPMSTSWLLGDCMESRGKQDLWRKQKPEALEALRETAIIHSAESSNRIEGVTIPHGRLRPLIIGNARPRDRSEEELAGYRRALAWIFSRRGPIRITPDVVLKLHALAQGGSLGDAGEWKRRDNEIMELLPSGGSRVRFVPTSARETPKAMVRLCDSYARLCEDRRFPPLIAAATFVFDFLCVHPFRDGNGRVSRLLTTLVLQSHGFYVSRYISLERLVEESKEDYYRVLGDCSIGWREGRNEILPWWNYLLGIVRAGYREFERQIEKLSGRPAKTELTRSTILEQVGQFTLLDLGAQLPSVSPQLIRKVLSELKAQRRATLTGYGRGAVWTIAPPHGKR